MGPLSLAAAAAASWAIRFRRAAFPPVPRPLERVLVLGYGAIGDALFFLPTLEALREGLPKARITWVSNPAPVLDELIPATGLVDERWSVEFRGGTGAASRAAAARRIAEAGFDAAVLTFAAPAHYFQEALAGVPLVAAHRLDGEGFRRQLVLGEPSRAALGADVAMTLGEQHHAARNLRLLDPLGLSAKDPGARPRVPLSEAHRAAAKALLPDGSPIVGIHLGPPVSYNFRAWNPERFGRLAAALAGTWPGARFALIGGPEEKASAERARAANPALIDLTGERPLLESFALLERCALVLACDTGLAKAAMALGVPTATLWGPSSPAESGIYWEPERHLDLRTGIECSPCSFSGMPREDRLNYLSCGHHACLGEMTAEWAAARVAARWPRLKS